ncbi:hypothetical protein [Maribacter sp. HTCC2170]|uniref:hypothetical protein n=1 Tax=Maribacter sp. (strain HTCC2170 / KCCM 42371) TaxID=313603 RepID=UPI00006BD544|nr:hypothetical protein [Maribacter sp. HTCC2170]EAR03018.1 hypothetical protein FB2170_07005 [Maribacter sp. HTCC2170]
MKKVLLLMLFLFVVNVTVNGQSIPKDQAIEEGFENISPERIYIHFNTTLLFPAEYLYYRVYCFDKKTERLSKISKIAYVELVSENQEVIFKQKVRLQEGVGQGDYFVPVSLPSGNYKLVAYTNWMRNFGGDKLFENDISIINPYQANQEAIIKSFEGQIKSSVDSILVEKEGNTESPDFIPVSVGSIKVGLEKDKYSKRAAVKLMLKGENGKDLPKGRYSLSVRQLGGLSQHGRTPINAGFDSKESFKDSPQMYLPELRGELIKGRIVSVKNSVSNAKRKVAISFPGDDYQFKIVETNSEGIFYVNLNKGNTSERTLVQVLGKERDEFNVQFDELNSLDYSQMVFKKITIDQSDKESILGRSIHNQIESAYFRFKPDSVLPTTHQLPFNSNNFQNYDLADYNSFKSLKETLLEIIKDTWVRKNADTGLEIEVKSMDLISNPNLLPLVIVDGVIVQDHERLLDYDARNLESIGVYRDKYVFGPQVYQGALVLKTKKSDYSQNVNDTSVKQFQILRPQLSKKYFTQQYDLDGDTTTFDLPDDRLQLVWMPQVDVMGKTFDVEFFTSDVTGTYEICLEGITNNGEFISAHKTFLVE